tara:strand:+ start:1230 stop:1457 length:228 start_codon:yes stop_codon:yes gene_type:complete
MYNKLLKAAISKYKAQKDEALANISIIFNKPVGIGEHTDFLVEIDKWIKKLSEAEENIHSLKNNFDEYGKVKGEK